MIAVKTHLLGSHRFRSLFSESSERVSEFIDSVGCRCVHQATQVNSRFETFEVPIFFNGRRSWRVAVAYADFSSVFSLANCMYFTLLPQKQDYLAVERCFLMASFVETKKQLFFYFYRVCGMSDDKFCVYVVTDAEYTTFWLPSLCCGRIT